MVEKRATVIWQGDLRNGRGEVSTPDGVLQSIPLNYPQRFEAATGASPEELIAAAHAGCFSMALAGELAKAGHPPVQLSTEAAVRIEGKPGAWRISTSHLMVRGDVPGLDEATFGRVAQQAKEACPVSRALQGNVEITLEAMLEREVAAQAR